VNISNKLALMKEEVIMNFIIIQYMNDPLRPCMSLPSIFYQFQQVVPSQKS